jgi:transcriptional regulator with XRE-family HTH domain
MDEARALKRITRLARTGALAELREHLGLSQAVVARAVGVDQSAVSRWESGKARPRPAHAVRLAEILELE